MGNNCGLACNIDPKKQVFAPCHIKQLNHTNKSKETPKIEQIAEANKQTASTLSPTTTKSFSSFHSEPIKNKSLALSSILDFYKVDPKIIGHGHFSNVRTARLRTSLEKTFAVKTISKDRVKLESYALERELEILTSIDHPNIVRFYETYEDDRFFHIVTEYCRGGDLLDRAISQGMDEQQCSIVMEKLFSAVQYLHENGIVHRDIKPENCLFVDESPKAEIKLIDFGLSSKITPGTKLTAPVGTPIYVAPEVLKQSYDHRCDYWSLGVIIYVLLGGEPPFDGETNGEIFEKIIAGKVSFEGKKWAKISTQAKDLICKLLEVNAEKRYTAAQALNHPWMKQVVHPKLSQQDALQVLTNLKGFTAKKRFSREILNTIVNLSTEDEIKKLREVFQHIDSDHHGIISVKDFQRVAKELGFTFTPKEIENMLSRLQIKPHDCINYTEFIIGAMDTSVYLTKDKLWTAFKHFSSENADEITAENLARALTRSGKDVTVGEIEMMISEADSKLKGKITFEEFCSMILKDLGTRDSFGDITRIISATSPPKLSSQVKLSQCKFPNFVHSYK